MKKRLAIETGVTVGALLVGAVYCGGSPSPTPVASAPSAAAASPAPTALRIDKDIVYVPGSSDPKHRLDLYMPPASAAKAAPTVVFIHGGYWVEGDRAYDPAPDGLYHSLGVALARQGVGVVVPSYRLAPGANIEAMLDDVMRALAWTYANIADHRGDPSHVFVMGHSAGGQLAALMCSNASLHASRGMRFSQLAGCIALSAVFDVVDMHAQHDTNFNAAITYPTFGRAKQRQRRYSPITHLGKTTRPLLIAIGENDFDYMIPQARAARDKLRAAGHAASYVEISGNDHMDMVRRFGSKADNMSRPVLQFIRDHS